MRPVWVGNAYGGIQWLAQSTVSWHNSDVTKQVQVIPSADGATIRITFVDVPTFLDAPLTVAFGIVATPTRDRYVEYRKFLSANPRIAWNYAFFPKGFEMTPAAELWATNYGSFIRERPEEVKPGSWWTRGTRRFSDKSYTGPYVSSGRTNSNVEYFDAFGDEWRANVNDTSIGSVAVTQSSPSYRDFFVWRYWKLMQKNPFAALYYDVSRPVQTNNIYGGGGAVKGGRLVMTESVLGTREIAKRMYHLVKERYPDGIVKYHMSGQVNMAWLSFTDSLVDGENTASIVRSNPRYPRTYRTLIGPARYRAEYMGHNFGPVGDWLTQFTRHGGWDHEDINTPAGADATDHILGLTLLHDSSLWKAYMSSLASERFEEALRRHDWGANYKMIPYWEQQIVKAPKNMFVSLFVVPTETPRTKAVDSAGSYYKTLGVPAKKAILVICNESDFEGTVKLPVDWETLGFQSTEGLSVENAVHSTTLIKVHDEESGKETWKLGPNPDETASIAGGKLVFPMTPWNFRMIVLENK
jgi:hypothetical protein